MFGIQWFHYCIHFYLLIKHAPVCVWSYVQVYEQVSQTQHHTQAVRRGSRGTDGQGRGRPNFWGPLPGSPTPLGHMEHLLWRGSILWYHHVLFHDLRVAYVKKELMWTFGPHDTCSNLPVLAGKSRSRYVSVISDFLHWEARGHVNVFIMSLRWLLTRDTIRQSQRHLNFAIAKSKWVLWNPNARMAMVFSFLSEKALSSIIFSNS